MKRVRLIRGWEGKYSPETTGDVRLSKPQMYRAIGEEEGLGDRREGEVRLSQQGKVTVERNPTENMPAGITREMRERADDEMIEQLREKRAQESDDPEIRMEKKNSEEWIQHQNVKIDDTTLVSPYVLCLAREPTTKAGWEKLRDALPKRYDTWTVTEDVTMLSFEIQCGVKRWLALNHISRHQIATHRGWIAYSYDEVPPSRNPEAALQEVAQMERWFRKRTKYRDQQEFRLAWNIQTPEWEELPDAIEVELTRTGLHLFRPWKPPEK